jgi:hypothetical protein
MKIWRIHYEICMAPTVVAVHGCHIQSVSKYTSEYRKHTQYRKIEGPIFGM